jgi:hypothetical protein
MDASLSAGCEAQREADLFGFGDSPPRARVEFASASVARQ